MNDKHWCNVREGVYNCPRLIFFDSSIVFLDTDLCTSSITIQEVPFNIEVYIYKDNIRKWLNDDCRLNLLHDLRLGLCCFHFQVMNLIVAQSVVKNEITY